MSVTHGSDPSGYMPAARARMALLALRNLYLSLGSSRAWKAPGGPCRGLPAHTALFAVFWDLPALLCFVLPALCCPCGQCRTWHAPRGASFLVASDMVVIGARVRIQTLGTAPQPFDPASFA